MSISKELWALIEKRLMYVHPNVEFQLDENNIVIRRERIAENKTGLLVYINGEIRPASAFEDNDAYNPLVNLVWRKRTTAVYPPSRKREIEKKFGKRKTREYFPDLHKKLTWRDPMFTTAKSMVSQFTKLSTIELVSPSLKELQVHG
jgi:hypothetical protein